MLRRLEIRWHLLDVPVSLLLLGMIFSGIFSPYPPLALFGPLWCQDSVLLLGMMVLLYFGVKQHCHESAQIEQVVAAMVLMGGMLAIIGLLDRFIGFGWSASYTPPRLVSLLRNPMFTGTYFAMLLPLGLCAAPAVASRRLRVALLSSTALMLLALALTLTRGAWLALALTLLLLAILIIWLFRTAIPRRAFSIALPAVFILLILLAMNPAIRIRAHGMFNLHDSTVQSRLVYMRSALGMFRARPLQGWGPGTFMLVSAQFRPLSTIVESGISINQMFCDALPHNLPLQLAAEMGLLGVIPYLLLLLCILYSAFRARHGTPWQRWMTAGLVGLLLANAFANLFAFDNSLTLAYFWIGAALLTAVAVSPRAPAVPTDRPVLLLGKPLSITFTILALLISAQVALCVESEFATAYYTRQGINASFQRARNLAAQNYPASLRVSAQGISAFKQAIAASLLPGYFSYQQLSLAYREQMLAARAMHDQQTADAASEEMFHYGEITLQQLCRDPEMLMYLAIESLDAHRLPEARELLSNLLVYQPHSAQVHILQAKLLMFEGDYSGGLAEAQQALSLDPHYARAYLWLARVQMLTLDRILLGKVPGRNPAQLVTGHDPEGSKFIHDTCHNFDQAMQLGMSFAASDYFKYATALFLDGQTEQAINEGQQLQGHRRELDDLCKRVSYFYYVKGQPEAARGVIAQLQQIAPTQPPSIPAALNPLDHLSLLKGLE